MRTIRSLLLVFAVSILAMPSYAGDSDIEKLTWLSGCWAGEKGEPGSGEQWTTLAGGTLLGVSRTVKQGRTIEFEFMRIHVNSAGIVEYVAMPSGQRTTAFALISISGTEAIFENPAHDFPQRVIYRRQGNQLHARIEGANNGVTKVIPFVMQRVSCETG